MTRYLLDTQAAIWMLTNDNRMPDDIRDELRYMEAQFYISNLTIVEIVHLQQCEKIDLPLSGEELISQLQRMGIATIHLDNNILVTLSNLPINRRVHSDPFDRTIIATAIARKLTLVSSDGKFDAYRKFKLTLKSI